MTKQIPVLIAGTNCLSGVTTWAEQLRTLLSDHPRYKLQLLYVGDEEADGFDLAAPSVAEAHELVRQLSPAIVVPNYLWELFLTGFEPGIRCVGMCHADSDEQYYRPLSWYEPYIAKFIGVSQECAEHLKRRLPFRAADVTMLPYGVYVPRSLNRRYQVAPLRLVYAGRVTQLQKRVTDFVLLVKHLLQANVHFTFDIIGEGDHYSSLKDEMNDRFPAGFVQFHGRLPHRAMPGVWLDHDVFLQVSDFEGTSVSMLEAMAHGVVPVVTAASSGISGVIHSQQNGFVVPVGDMAAMAQVLARLASDQSMLAAIGRGAHETAQEYSLELYGNRFTQFLDDVLEADHEVDVYQRYGMFGAAHPLFKQRQLIADQRQQILELQQGGFQQLLDRKIGNLLPTKVRQILWSKSA